MKGFLKGFKYISQIFVYKQHEMEIGCPTDVRHVAHIGWDGSSANAPSWMNEFKTGSAFTPSMSSFGDPNCVTVGSWTSQDFQQAKAADTSDDPPRTDPPKKSRWRKTKAASPSSSSRSSRSRASSFAAAIAGEE
ncbi:hypothetical protein QJS04_geneDACA018094 [Acorus gramineus]|uniref:CRIB domain-containing protein n=1 Tax=Acorus gramineus TaxID=55184 RepID=A0AAV9A7I9_ACOGR|nr:hypothetical protein QJS04_geneDACA018094 [Acorus gramineus]